MSKGSDILNKLIAAGLLLASIIFFGNMDRTDEYVVPGFLFAMAGLVIFWLSMRRDARPVADPELERRVVELSERLAATQGELGGALERLDRLTDEHEFMRQLAGRAPAARIAQPVSRPPEVPAQPAAPELSGPPR